CRLESVPKAAGSHDEFGVEPIGVGVAEDAWRTVRTAALIGRCLPFDDGDVLTGRGARISGCGSRQPCVDDVVVAQNIPAVEWAMVTGLPLSRVADAAAYRSHGWHCRPSWKLRSTRSCPQPRPRSFR